MNSMICYNPFYLSISLFVKEIELKKLPFGIIYVKKKHLIVYFYIMPGLCQAIFLCWHKEKLPKIHLTA